MDLAWEHLKKKKLCDFIVILLTTGAHLKIHFTSYTFKLASCSPSPVPTSELHYFLPELILVAVKIIIAKLIGQILCQVQCLMFHVFTQFVHSTAMWLFFNLID